MGEGPVEAQERGQWPHYGTGWKGDVDPRLWVELPSPGQRQLEATLLTSPVLEEQSA